MKLFKENISNQTRKKSGKSFWIIFLAILFLVAVAGVIRLASPKLQPKPEEKKFQENFQEGRSIEETGKMSESLDKKWWVNSGGWMEISGGTGKTIWGELSTDSIWYKKYKDSNSSDTDGGLHPQNIFRLVTRSKWQNFSQQAYFRINKMNFSASENRNESNGILLFNRYEDGDNLYYTGLRVDGTSVIKKKYAGKYYTLDEKTYFPGPKYDRDTSPNLLPLGEWIGLKSEFRNTPDGNVDIKLYVDIGQKNQWKLAASVVDDGRKDFGTHIIDGAGYGGIRTDFMDVEFNAYEITEL